MKKIFLDIGAHVGQSIDKFHEQIDDADKWEIIAFEPIQFNNLLQHIIKKGYEKVTCKCCAVGRCYGTMNMYKSIAGGQGNTALLNKITGNVNYNKPVIVDVIDFIDWFKFHISTPDDFVLIKMNIEGGEYELMPRLIKILDYVNGIWIKLHHNKFNEPQKTTMVKVYEDFKIAIEDYKSFVFCDATESDYDFNWLIKKINEKR